MYDLPDAPWIRDAELNGVPEPDTFKCPVCGEENPERFFFQKGDIVGCSYCIHEEDADDYACDHPWLFDKYSGD